MLQLTGRHVQCPLWILVNAHCPSGRAPFYNNITTCTQQMQCPNTPPLKEKCCSTKRKLQTNYKITKENNLNTITVSTKKCQSPRDRASANTLCLPGMCLIIKSYLRLHLIKHWFLSLSLLRNVRGLWSVNTSIGCWAADK